MRSIAQLTRSVLAGSTVAAVFALTILGRQDHAVLATAPNATTPSGNVGVATHAQRRDYIVQADTVPSAREAVWRAGGVVGGDIALINAVQASLDLRSLTALRAADEPHVRIYDDTPVRASSVTGSLPETYYPTEVSASDMHKGGVTGRGVTVAVLFARFASASADGPAVAHIGRG